jgi:hypothetical protein
MVVLEKVVKNIKSFLSICVPSMPTLILILFLFVLGFGEVYATCITTGPDSGCPTLWNVQGQMSGNTWLTLKIIYLVSAVCGLVLTATSLCVLKAGLEGGGQQNNNVKKGIVLFILGGSMISLPFMAKVSQNSALDSGIINSSNNGANKFVIPTEQSAFSSGTSGTFWASNNPDGD